MIVLIILPKNSVLKNSMMIVILNISIKSILGLSFLGGLLIGALFGRRSCCYPSCQISRLTVTLIQCILELLTISK